MNTVKGGVSNMVDLAEWKAFETMQNTKGAVGNVLNNLDDKAVSAHNATYNALKNDAVPGIDQPGPIDIPEPPIDPGTTDAPIVDPTPSAEGMESPIQDTPLQTEGAEPPTSSPSVVESTQPPAQPDSSQQKFQQSMNQMNYMNQQMQQAGQRMQGGRHITGAESEEDDN